MRKKLSFLAIFFILTALLAGVIVKAGFSNSAEAGSLPAVPTGLSSKFELGLANGPGNIGWMTSSGSSWNARYQYLCAGVNTGSGWATWGTNFALNYMNESANAGMLPVLTYYQMLQSSPASGADEGAQDYNNLNNTSTMNAYYNDFKTLMDQAKAFGKPVVIHVEPDLWAYLQQRSSNPNSISASVASSGYAGLSGLPNTVAGFAKALVTLRNTYAPNALLAFHVSTWATPYGDLSTSTDPNFNVSGAATAVASFYTQLGANFDLMFYDISDRDAGLYQSWGNPYKWWDTNNSAFPNFNRFHQFAAGITQATGKRGMLWQVPIGNTVYRTMNNTTNHWQDNKVQYYLGSGNSSHLQDLANSGIIGILWGRGDGQTTSYDDSAKDGITNPNPINNNNLTSSVSDDDGGYLRGQAKAYYAAGGLTLPSSTGSTNPTPTTAPATTVAPTTAPATTVAPGTTPPNPAPAGSTNGLNAEYYNNMTLSGTPVVKRVDSNVNFDWGLGSPASGIPTNGFSARWTGQVKAPSSATYSFCTQSDDGVRLWVNGVQVVNDWTSHGSTEDCGQIALTQGQLYNLKLEYFENGGAAIMQLKWSSPTITKQAIPTAQLFTGSTTTVTPAPTTPAATTAPATTVAPTPTPVQTTVAPASAPQNWVLSSNAGGTLTSGSTLSIKGNFTAPVNTNGSYIMDVELYDANWVKVGQWYSTQAFTAGQTRTFGSNWVAKAGQYQISVGIFDTNWNFIGWQNGSLFTVK
ncbi:MAG TPA: PA14 domain-containing protein [Chloroflexia bacterium]|nr:PA14 domain-containing protein [Chloroflexia bacterium]